MSIGTLNPTQLNVGDRLLIFDITLTDYIDLFILDISFYYYSFFEKTERASLSHGCATWQKCILELDDGRLTKLLKQNTIVI